MPTTFVDQSVLSWPVVAPLITGRIAIAVIVLDLAAERHRLAPDA